MDEIVTEQLNIEYNGGCRTKRVCKINLTMLAGRNFFSEYMDKLTLR